MKSNLKARKIAVVGATGNVGRALLSILAEQGIPLRNVTALASDRSVGSVVSYGEANLTVQALKNYDFSGTDIALFSAGSVVSSEYAPRATAQGCVVIDNTSHFRMDPDIPLIIPEVNGQALENFHRKNIVANPNCSTIQLLMALAPLHRMAGIKRIVTCTYQSTSGAGQEAMNELFVQTKATYVNQAVDPHYFSKQIAFNVIPHIDRFMEDGQTKEEWKMAVETKKILGDSIELVATCVRVPVFIGHAVAAHVEFNSPITPDQARKSLRHAQGITVMDNPDDLQYITPLECAGDDSVFVSRIRKDSTIEHGLSMWIVCDNIRKGAALNAVQIAHEVSGYLAKDPRT